ncbi:MAG: glycosyltransferase family 39 protein [Patescibacteria group bacterium]|jgi:hypothetical protein
MVHKRLLSVKYLRDVNPLKFLEIPLLLLLISISAFLRFKNLGYSEFQDDEKKAIAVTKTFDWDFFMAQRKGPIQFLVTEAINIFEKNITNELTYRLPFTIMNLASVVVVWLLLRRLFKNPFVSFLGALLYAVNGLVVGFARIAQYQNLNLLFSPLSLYFYLRLYQDKKKPILFSTLGTATFCISLLSHWDATFYLLPISYFYLMYIKKQCDKKQARRITIINIVLACILLLPFLIPYVLNQKNNQGNIDYLSRRLGLSTYSIERHKFIFELYNPFVAMYLIPLTGLFAFLKFKKNLMFILWAGVNFLLIRFFMQKPGTHIYNYVIPMIYLAAAGVGTAIEKLKKRSTLAVLPILALTGFLVYQTYILFVDHTPEYPWYEKNILSYKKFSLVAPQYVDKEVLTFGFPHFRNWKEMDKIVSDDPDGCTYITNEGKEISQIYMLSRYGIMGNRCYYIINIKRPFITRGNETSFAETVGKKKIYSFKQGDETMASMHKIRAK